MQRPAARPGASRSTRKTRRMRTHQMHVEADNGVETLFVCPEQACGRRLVLRRGGGLVVIDRGDQQARHVGGFGPITIGAEVKQ